MSRVLSEAPQNRVGMYSTIEDVPDRYLLAHHSSRYEGDNTWQAYLTEYLFPNRPSQSPRFYRTAELVGESWIASIATVQRHHALPKPSDVATWVSGLRDERAARTVNDVYWVRLEDFFTWLQAHFDHPHVYHPPLMAAIDSPAVQEVWRCKLGEQDSA